MNGGGGGAGGGGGGGGGTVSSAKTPADFLKSIRGRPVVVKLNSGVDYRGKISAVFLTYDRGGGAGIKMRFLCFFACVFPQQAKLSPIHLLSVRFVDSRNSLEFCLACCLLMKICCFGCVCIYRIKGIPSFSLFPPFCLICFNLSKQHERMKKSVFHAKNLLLWLICVEMLRIVDASFPVV
jgi:hypothetical protein